MKKVVNLTTKIDCSEIDDTTKKVRRLRKLLKEANSLAAELASRNLVITVSTVHLDAQSESMKKTAKNPFNYY